MKKVLTVTVLFLFFSVLVGVHASYAEMCGCMGQMGEGMHRGGMSMGGMKHQGMGMMEDMMGSDHPMWKHLMGIGLDDKQKAAIKDIKSRLMKDTIRRKADLHIAQLEMKELLQKDPMDMKAVEAKLKQTEGIRTDIHLSQIRAMQEAKAVLTPDQIKKFKEMMEMGHMMGDMGMMHGGGCGKMGGMMQHGCMEEAQPSEKTEEAEPPMQHMHH